jgi:hypothetical protein
MKLLLQLIALLLVSITINAQGWGQTQKIVPDDRFIGQQFGADVAIDGNYAVVGVLVSNSARDAYVYENDGNGNWVQTQKLQSPNFNQFDHFGTAVAISGDYIFVGAWGQSYDASDSNFLSSAGAAYIFKKQASGLFEFQQKIVASDREALNAFGYGLAVNGDYAIVSPVRHDFDVQPGTNFLDDAGAAYIFERDGTGTWNEVQKIVASDRAPLDYFGQIALAVNGDYISVGSYGEDEDENGANFIQSAGAVYIFERDTNGAWSEIQKIVASDRAHGAYFGWSIALDGINLVVGANQDNNYRGSAYVFEKDENNIWNQTQKLTASNSENNDQFGYDLDIEGNRIIIGARYRDIGSPGDDGAAYVFEKEANTWTQTAFIYDAFNKTSEYFGYSVGISGDYALVGAYQDSEDENEENYVGAAGAAFIFNANEPNTLSVVENNFGLEFKAYPNPTQGKVFIDFKSVFEAIEISVVNILGQQILKQTYNSTSQLDLNFSDLEKGLYIVNLKLNNSTEQVLKIIKN